MKKTKLAKHADQKIAQVIADYWQAWVILKKYDDECLTLPTKKTKAKYQLDYTAARQAVLKLKKALAKKEKISNIFGVERQKKILDGIVKNIYQTYSQKELYPTVATKAAHLLYFIIKDHPFVDGNKRIGAFLFMAFLAQNDYMLKPSGEKKINDNALVALTVLVAVSPPKEKEVMIKLIANFLSQ